MDKQARAGSPRVADTAHDCAPRCMVCRDRCRFKGDARSLTKAERWLLVVISVPRFSEKLAVFRCFSSFDDEERGLTRQLKIMSGACRQVMTSERLKAVLAAVLAIGNFLNQGTRKGEAQGFKLDSLAALTSTKATDKSTTVLDVLVSTVEKKGGSKLLAFMDDLSLLADAAHLALGDTANGVRRLARKVHAAKAEARAEAADMKREDEEAAAGNASDGGASNPASTGGAGGGDARAAMLSAMLAARGGGGAAKKKKKKKAKPSVPNVSWPADRETFVRAAKEFASQVSPRVRQLEERVAQAQAVGRELAKFFAEVRLLRRLLWAPQAPGCRLHACARGCGKEQAREVGTV